VLHGRVTDRRFYLLLAAWTFLAVAPALLVTFGVIGGPIDSKTTITGAAALTWVGGWLLQFAAFFWLMSLAGKQNFIWWFIASLVPWAADWTMPLSPILVVVWPAVAIATAVWIGLAERAYESLEDGGVRADGVVLQVYNPLMNVVVNNVYIKRKLRLRIERSDGATPYEATYNGLFMIGDIPSAGDRIPLLVDPANPQHFQYNDKSGDAPA
jgi:hypothetical protein